MAIVYNHNKKANNCLRQYLSLYLSLSLFLLFLFSCSSARQRQSVSPLIAHQTGIGWIEAVTCKGIVEGEESKPHDESQVFSIQDKQAVMWLKIKDLKEKHTLRWKWYDPQGNLYYDTKDFSIGSENQQ